MLLFRVKFEPEKSIAEIVPESVTLELPSVKVLVPVPVELIDVAVILKLPVLNVPAVSVMGPQVIALPKVQPPPAPLNAIVFSDLPLVVIVLPVVVAVKVILKLLVVTDPPDGRDTLPKQVLNVPNRDSDCDAVTVKSVHVAEDDVTDTMPVPEFVSKITLSEDVGAVDKV